MTRLLPSHSLDAWHGSLGGRVHLSPFVSLHFSGWMGSFVSLCLPLSPFICVPLSPCENVRASAATAAAVTDAWAQTYRDIQPPAVTLSANAPVLSPAKRGASWKITISSARMLSAPKLASITVELLVPPVAHQDDVRALRTVCLHHSIFLRSTSATSPLLWGRTPKRLRSAACFRQEVSLSTMAGQAGGKDVEAWLSQGQGTRRLPDDRAQGPEGHEGQRGAHRSLLVVSFTGRSNLNKQ